MKRKATITVETERLVVVGRARGGIEHWCQQCAATVNMVAAAQAVAITQLTERHLSDLSEGGLVHRTETAHGEMLFCLDALLQQIDRRAQGA